MQKPASGIRRGRGAAGGSAVAALFGAAATVVVLTGVVAIAASPRSLSDDVRLPVSAETFEVAPFASPEFLPEAHAVAPASDHPGELSFKAADEIQG